MVFSCSLLHTQQVSLFVAAPLMAALGFGVNRERIIRGRTDYNFGRIDLIRGRLAGTLSNSFLMKVRLADNVLKKARASP
jgi:hypothetical protein